MYISGAEKRKRKKELHIAVASLPKISTFYSRHDDSAKSVPPDQATTSAMTVESTTSTTGANFSEAGDAGSAAIIIDSQLLENVVINSADTRCNEDISSDPAAWIVTDEFCEEIVRRPAIAQNLGDFSKSERDGKTQKRYLPPTLFKRTMANGEIVCREWLSYSLSTGNVYCVPCKLFSRSNSAFRDGFSDWIHCQNRVIEHENSSDHRNCIKIWCSRKMATCRIDCSLVKQVELERKYWRDVLQRAVEVIKFLAERGLPFRGNDEVWGSANNGNYMGIIELVAKFDPFLSQHLQKYGGAGRGIASYLSKTVCDELILLMAMKVEKAIIDQINEAKYYSIIVDSTPDLSHVDQLAVIIRIVQSNGKPVERFIRFLQLRSHTAEAMTDLVLALLTELGIDISNCRGQSYDNAANMSGIYTGLQARVKEINPVAYFVPCAAHSLNLVGVCSVDSCLAAVSYFGIMQSLYNFFSASTYRWQTLKDFSPSSAMAAMVKTISATRWSARADATKCLFVHYKDIKNALIAISADDRHKIEARTEAHGLAKKMEQFETALMTVIWHTILDRFSATSASLQKMEIDLDTAVKLYQSLIRFVQEMRGTFDDIENKAKEYVDIDNHQYKEVKRRLIKRKRFFDESNAADTVHSPRDNFKIETFNCIMDCLIAELRKRLTAYSGLHKLFGFITEFASLSVDELRARASNLVTAYPADLEQSFVDEFKQFTFIIATDKDHSVLHMNEILKSDGGLLLATFPNVGIALRLYLTIPVTNCEGERSFSTLSRVKNHLRTTMTQQRLQALSIMCIESEVLQTVDFVDVINDFANRKTRRRDL